MLKLLHFGSFVFPSVAARYALKLFLTPKRYDRPEAERPWHAAARTRSLNTGLVVHEWGIAGQKIVLLVHGWEGRGSQMGAFVELLTRNGFHVIALDGPAHGDSPGTETNAGLFSRALVETQRELGSIEAVIAHSFGGGCTVLAISLGMQIKKFVTIASPADYEKVVSDFLNIVRLSPWSKKKFYQILTKKARLELAGLNIEELGRHFEGRTLIIHDRNDKEVDCKNALALRAAWPHAELMLTEGLGHRRILKNSDVIQRAVEFIRDGQIQNAHSRT